MDTETTTLDTESPARRGFTLVIPEREEEPASNAIDFSLDLDAPDPVLPAGRYAGYIIRADARYSKAGDPMMSIQYAVETADEWANTRVFGVFVLTSAHLWRFKAFVRSLGFRGPFNAWTDAPALENMSVWLEIEQGEYNGQPQARVKHAAGRDTAITADPPF